MTAKILTFSSRGDTTLLEYDPATANMDEVNKVSRGLALAVERDYLAHNPALLDKWAAQDGLAFKPDGEVFARAR